MSYIMSTRAINPLGKVIRPSWDRFPAWRVALRDGELDPEPVATVLTGGWCKSVPMIKVGGTIAPTTTILKEDARVCQVIWDSKDFGLLKDQQDTIMDNTKRFLLHQLMPKIDEIIISSLFWSGQVPATMHYACSILVDVRKARWTINYSTDMEGAGEYVYSIVLKGMQEGDYATRINPNKALGQHDLYDRIMEKENRERTRDYYLHILVWNCAEAGHPTFRKNFFDSVRTRYTNIVLLTDTNVGGVRARDLSTSFGYDQPFVAYPKGFGNGMWLLYDENEIKCEVLVVSPQEIQVEMEFTG